MMKFAHIFVLSLPVLAQTPSADEIIRRCVEVSIRNEARDRDYTMVRDVLQRRLDGTGRVVHTESQRYDVMFVHNAPFSRLIQKDGRPLTADEERKQQEKLARAARDAEKRRKELEEDRKRDLETIRELPRAYTFRLVGSEEIDGSDMWVIEGLNKPGYRPSNDGGRLLAKMGGKLWIEKSSYQWVKAQVRTVDTISFGWFLARLKPGAIVEVDNKRIDEDLWLPQRVLIRFDARLGLIKTMRGETEVLMSNFRKFQADSRVVSIEAR